MSKLVVFDVDGTILNSFGFFGKIILDYSEKNRLLEPDLLLMQTGYADPDNFDFGWGVSKEEQRKHLRNIFDIADTRSLTEIPDLFDGVEETLLHLKDTQHTLAIITAKPRAPLTEMLEYHKLNNFFASIRSGCDAKLRGEKEKPEPDMLNSIMRELKFAPDESVMIGDTTMDILMGRRANTGTVGVTWGAHPKELLKTANPHYIVETKIPDVVPLIKRDFINE